MQKVASVYPLNCFQGFRRLKSKQDYAQMRAGKSFVLSGVRFVYRENALKHARLGLAVSRKYGNAVYRNRCKRIARDVFRRHSVKHASLDVLLIPFSSADVQDSLFDQGFSKIIKQSEQ